MKNVILLLLASTILLFGCAGEAPQEDMTVTEEPATPTEEGTTPPMVEPEEEECDSTYAFSQLPSVKLSQTAAFTITATCAAGKDVALYLNDNLAGHMVIPNNDPTVLNFDIAAKMDGTNNVKVTSDQETLYSEDWVVAPLGSSDISGSDYDQISNKKWIAVAFDVENTIEVGGISGYIKRLEAATLQESDVMVEIRGDEGGNPSDGVIASSKVPITQPTLSDNWIHFNYDEVSLSPGRYWVVFRVAKEEPTIVGDVVTLHYVAKDNLEPANDYTRQMELVWSDSLRVWQEAPWAPLPFDKTYAVTISTNGH